MNVLVAGGSGFVGRTLCDLLADRDHDVTAASRSPDGIGRSGRVETATLDVTEPDLEPVVDGHDAVVNLVALPSHVQPRGRSHEAVHLDGTRNLVRASENTGVERFVQMSGLGVESDVSTAYLDAKRSAERVVRESTLDWVTYRPSVVFGDGCAFVPFVERLATARVVPLPGGGNLAMQPIWVGDLGPMIADGVDGSRHVGRTYEIGGPERLTLREIVESVRPGAVVVPVPMPLAAVGSAVAEVVPGIPFGRDQYRVFGLDNTVDENDVTAFGVATGDLRTLDEYLAGDLS